jgi:ribosome-associated protein
MNDDDLWDGDEALTPESKSSRKRQMHALQDLGEALVGLTSTQLAKLDLDNEPLLEAIELAQRINHHSGKRRQMQYIGKLMRSADSERIAQSLDALHEGSRKEKAREHMIEAARSALISRGDDALQEVLAIWPNADRQMLRQLSRSAIDEQKKALPPTSARKLFRYLRSLPESDSES